MGGVQGATSGEGKPLIAQRHFEATIHRRFVKDTVVTLEFQDQFWNQPRDNVIEIKDVALFKVPPISGDAKPPTRKLLLDAYGIPVVGMEEHEIPPATAQRRAFAVIPDGFAATKELFRFETYFTVPTDVPLRLELPDSTPDALSRVVVLGRWLTREAAVAIQRQGGDYFMIARVYVVGHLLDGKYRMDVAPGVDLALMVLIAAAMDQENHKYERSTDRVRIRSLVKAEMKKEKKQLKAQQKLAKAQHGGEPPATAS